MNIQQITENLLCSGCGTCYTVCSHNSISMKKTPSMGLLHAEVDVDKCIDCGLCLKMCPSGSILEERNNLTKAQIVGDVKACYVGRSLNKEIFSNAQSGGMVTAILKYLFESGLIDAAISCRMDFGDSRPDVHYSITTSVENLGKNQKSCYTQVDIVSALKETSDFKNVAVVGLPCHIQGVSKLMQLKRYSNIRYRIGLICDKTYCDAYMDAILYGENKPQGLIKINYRHKNFTYKGNYYSYQNAPIVIENKQGDKVIVPKSKRMYLKDFFVVPKCKICWDKLNTRADIVLGDPWGLNGEYDDSAGDSVIVVRSKAAETLIAQMKEESLIEIHNVQIEDVATGQQIGNRVYDIQKYDFDQMKITWGKYESQNREKIIPQIVNTYNRKRWNNHIKNIIKKILNLC